MGFGFILRDYTGKLIAARRRPCSYICRPNEVGPMGVREALKWIKALRIDSCLIESDCLQVVNNLLHDHSLSTSFDLILNDIRKLASEFTHVSFLFAKRSANRVAHLLAREALSKSDCMDCSFVPFPSMAHLVAWKTLSKSDCMDCSLVPFSNNNKAKKRTPIFQFLILNYELYK
ncbi:MAG: ribonuclease H family protein, partial [Candidatus Phytoplasma australasiaticum]|nr:ribonuclease H family protein [Candidatus Phytoplasma australasiaticum]